MAYLKTLSTLSFKPQDCQSGLLTIQDACAGVVMQVICDLLDAALRGEIYFEELAKGLKENQIDSLSFDFVTGEHRFYTHDNQVFNHHSPYEPGYPISKVFNKEGVVAALEAFDKRKVTAVEFHKALAEAGVCFARCFEKVNRAIYMSQSGETYLEQW